jgi:hypothetical protein
VRGWMLIGWNGFIQCHKLCSPCHVNARALVFVSIHAGNGCTLPFRDQRYGIIESRIVCEWVGTFYLSIPTPLTEEGIAENNIGGRGLE